MYIILLAKKSSQIGNFCYVAAFGFLLLFY